MPSINTARVVLGGIAAGVVIDIGESILNLVIAGEEMDAAIARMDLPAIGGGAIGLFLLLGVVLGIAMVWLYAAIRPRYGPGPKTALCAGATVWFLAPVYSSFVMVVLGMFPLGSTLVGVLWGLGEMLAAALIGAYLYRE